MKFLLNIPLFILILFTACVKENQNTHLIQPDNNQLSFRSPNLCGDGEEISILYYLPDDASNPCNEACNVYFDLHSASRQIYTVRVFSLASQQYILDIIENQDCVELPDGDYEIHVFIEQDLIETCSFSIDAGCCEDEFELGFTYEFSGDDCNGDPNLCNTTCETFYVHLMGPETFCENEISTYKWTYIDLWTGKPLSANGQVVTLPLIGVQSISGGYEITLELVFTDQSTHTLSVIFPGC